MSCLHKKSWACISSKCVSTVDTRSNKLDERLSEKVNVISGPAGGIAGLVGISTSVTTLRVNYELTFC